MKLDWLEVRQIGRELADGFCPARVENIWALEDQNILVFKLYRPWTERSEDKNLYLHISLKPQDCVLYVLPVREAASDQLPPFCSLLRKHLEGLRLLAVETPHAERVILLRFGSRPSEPQVEFSLVCELQGVKANLTLLDASDCVVLDWRRTAKVSEPFVLQTHPLPSFAEIDWESEQAQDARAALPDLGPMISLCAEFTPRFLQWVARVEPEALLERERLQEYLDQAMFPQGTFLLADECGLLGFTIYQPEGEEGKDWHGPRPFLQVLAEFVPGEQDREFLRRERQKVLAQIQKEIADKHKLMKSLQTKRSEYETWPEIERKTGLFSAQRIRAKAYSSQVVLVDYFTDNCAEFVLPLDPKLSVEDNVNEYYRKVRKYKRGLPKVMEQIEGLDVVLLRLNRLLQEASHSMDRHHLELLHQKLQSMGVGPKQRVPTTSKAKPKAARLRMFMTSAGLTVYAGRNDKENDYLVRHAGTAEDLWFHAHGVAGSHVLLKDGKNASSDCIREAAQLAAWLSKGREESRLPVIYTQLKHVHNVKGAQIGQVRVDTHETITVRIDRGIVGRMEQNLMNHASPHQA